MDCSHPRLIKVPKSNKRLYVPCGHCIACRIRKTSEWKLRLMMENDMWPKSSFLTLTYDDEHLHVTNCGRMTLYPDDLQDFVKRARMRIHRDLLKNDVEYAERYRMFKRGLLPSPPPSCKFYACGEYGDQFKRPHYHLIFFGYDFKKLGDWWIHHYTSDGKPVYTSNELIDLWPFGLPTVDTVIPERCSYVAGYVQKKVFYDPMQYWKEYGCCIFPFQRCSQGIGLSYHEKHSDFFRRNGEIRATFRGVSYSVPRYFIKKDFGLKAELDEQCESRCSELASKEIEYLDLVFDGFYDQKERELKFRANIKR